ncbi:hypothetical protein [Cupriavidus pauculus]|uniref:hypothetical protein n=1 Tax=Cupriavidus pauculus TaxID=82633 RepID=UPI0015E0094A|nr:hypothetical protein [Cupriavidus pauculus]
MKIHALTFVEPLHMLGLTIIRTPFLAQCDVCVTDDYGNLVDCEALGDVLAYRADMQMH